MKWLPPPNVPKEHLIRSKFNPSFFDIFSTFGEISLKIEPSFESISFNISTGLECVFVPVGIFSRSISSSFSNVQVFSVLILPTLMEQPISTPQSRLELLCRLVWK